MNEVQEIKNRLDLIEFIQSRVPLKNAGRHFKGLCPFHNEKSPSFMVSPERQVWHCFGCGKGGSIFDFLMEYEHIDFVEALETLAEHAGVTLTKRAATSPEESLKEKIYVVNHLASEYYQYLLTKHPIGEAARAYIKRRKISEIRRFTLFFP